MISFNLKFVMYAFMTTVLLLDGLASFIFTTIAAYCAYELGKKEK